jgi:hypothetical protein
MMNAGDSVEPEHPILAITDGRFAFSLEVDDAFLQQSRLGRDCSEVHDDVVICAREIRCC